jgi:hypothetical protein
MVEWLGFARMTLGGVVEHALPDAHTILGRKVQPLPR